MATKRITDLTNVTSAQNTDLLVMETSSGTRAITKNNLLSNTLPLTGGTLSGDLFINHSDSTESKVRVVNSLHDGNFTTSVNGNFGIYDNTFAKWIVKCDTNGTVTVDGHHSNDFQKNISIHNKIDLKSGTFYDCILGKINEGFRGGKIEINNYCPSDTCNGNYWGFVEWTCNENRFAHLIFYNDRWEVMHVREISFNEETDTGWQRIGDGCNSDTVDGYHVTASTTDLTAGSSSLATNMLYFVYE